MYKVESDLNLPHPQNKYKAQDLRVCPTLQM